MIAQTVDAADLETDDAAASALRYRLDVVASGTADVVCSAGGWLCDRATAGWEVNVLLPRPTDIRPLQILGVQTTDLASLVALSGSTLAGHGLAVSADIFASDFRVRQAVLKALNCPMTEVTLWNDSWPLAVGHRTTAVQHVLSAAARAFKAHALAAAGLSSAVGPTETLRSDMKTGLPVASDLLPAR